VIIVFFASFITGSLFNQINVLFTQVGGNALPSSCHMRLRNVGWFSNNNNVLCGKASSFCLQHA
jgi:hypothetical protein